MNTKYLSFALIGTLAACSGSPQALVPAGPAVPIAPAAAVALHPDHGTTALPGGWLPCGFPNWQDDARALVVRHDATCSVAISNNPGVSGNDEGGSWLPPGLHPADLRAAYHLPTGAAGRTVAIVDAYDDPQAENDLLVYRAKYRLGPCTTANGCFRKVNQLGQAGPYPAHNAAWAHEVALDTQMVSAVCPHCPILLVEANSASIDDLGAAVDTAVKLGARVVSNSYYADEWSTESAEDVHFHHPGVAITVSSGDQAVPNAYAGYGGGSYGGDAMAPNVTQKTGPYYPAVSPYVTAVGGTTLAEQNGAWIEKPWGYAGVGCSLYEPRPAFQGAVCSTRSGVDMAVVGDPLTGVSMYSRQAGGWTVAGGTSVGAPIVAAAYALSGYPSGPAFSYKNPGAFNALAPAGATGLGSPRGVSGL